MILIIITKLIIIKMIFSRYKIITTLFVSLILAIVSSDDSLSNQPKYEESTSDQMLPDNKIIKEHQNGKQTFEVPDQNIQEPEPRSYSVRTQASGSPITRQLSTSPQNSRFDTIRSHITRPSIQKSETIRTSSLPKSETSKKLSKTGQPKTQDEIFRTLSKSKASVWVDTNKGNIFSTSIGSSHLEKDKEKVRSNNGLNGHSKNMLLTLLIQPESNEPISAVPAQSRESNLKPILLLLQQQQDLSEILLEKEEKLEKMNVHLQQQIKHQHVLIVELLEQIKLFLEVLNVPSYRGEKLAASRINEIKGRIVTRDNNNKEPHLTSSSSSANAIVLSPKNNKEAIRKANDHASGASESPVPIESVQKHNINGQHIPDNIPNETNPTQIAGHSIHSEPADNVNYNTETTIVQEQPLVTSNQKVVSNKYNSARTTINPFVSRDKSHYVKKVKPILAESGSEVKGSYRKPITELNQNQ